MPLKVYGILKVQPIATMEAMDSAHLEIHTADEEVHYRIAINVKSQATPPELRYIIFEDYKHPITQELGNLPNGFTPLQSKTGGMALDYIRGNLFDYHDMKIAHHISGSYNELMDAIEKYADIAIRTGDAAIYAFGEKWGPEDKRDRYFGFKPGCGVHDIHMNQGNSGNWMNDNGVWQDGGMFIHFPSEKRWVAIFLAFQSQTFHTDNINGNPIPRAEHPEENTVIIVSALLNPISGNQTVSLLNTTSGKIDLSGWSIIDSTENNFKLNGIMKAGEFLTLAIPKSGLVLPNTGGIITLLDNKGMKVNGVYYTAQDFSVKGWTRKF